MSCHFHLYHARHVKTWDACGGDLVSVLRTQATRLIAYLGLELRDVGIEAGTKYGKYNELNGSM